MRNWVKKTLLALGSTVVGVGVIVLPFIIFIQPTNEFGFGNFQSYISEDVKQALEKRYKMNWQYYGSNSEIPTFINNKTLDVAVATNNMVAQLAISDKIMPIPWDKFGLIKDDGTEVKTYKDLKGFVSESTWWLSQSIARAVSLPKLPDGSECDNLLAYCVPYFLQNFVFCYRGEKINNIDYGSVSFKSIFDYISQDKRFNSKNSNVMMIDDYRSVFNIAKVIKGDNDINPEVGILKQDSDLNSINSLPISYFDDVYDSISDYYSKGKRNVLTFNSDSSIVLNKVALNQTSGAFMYNGDAVYAAMGGDNSEGALGLPQFGDNQDFFSIVPSDTFYAMDGIVINKSIDDKKLDDAIEIIKMLCLSGLQKGENISERDSDGEYKYLSTQNFDYLNYTPCYEKLYAYSIDQSENGYFEQNDITDASQKKLLIDLLTINPVPINDYTIELPLTELTKSNINLAYVNFKTKI